MKITCLYLVVSMTTLTACGDPGGGAGVDVNVDVDVEGDAGADAVTDVDVDADATTTPPTAWVMGYYAGYEAALYPVADIAWDTLTHLAVAFYLPSADGTLAEHLFIDDTNGPALARALVAAGHARGVKVIASVGGAGMRDAFVAASDSETRASFVSNIVSIVERYGYDGIDLDWEPITEDDRAAVGALVVALRTELPNAILTMPVGFENRNFPGDLSLYASLAVALDQINIMSYSMTGAYDGWLSWHSSALSGDTGRTPTSITDTVDAYLAAGVPAAKLGVGAGFYGTCYTPPVDGPLQELDGSSIPASDGAVSYRTIIESYDSEAARRWDDDAQVPYLSFSQATGPAGCGFVTYEDARSLAAKADWLAARGLGGIIIWTINQGHLPSATERDPLLRALHDALR